MKSDPTVLLWGDRWWLPRHTIPVPFPDPTQAADMLAAAWPGRKGLLRLVYQPADFASVPVTCPLTDRATIAAALSDQHPAVLHPAHVWGHEPLAEVNGLGRTLLHYETKPALFALVQRLEELGFVVESVWPLATWLAALAPEPVAGGSLTVTLLDARRYYAYRHAAGERTVQQGEAKDCAAVLNRPAAAPGNADATELILVITTDDSLADELGQVGRPDNRHLVGVFSIWEALAKPVALPAKHPAQLLPPLPKLSLMRMIVAANALCLLLACGAAVLGWREQRRQQRAGEGMEREKAELRAEVAHLQANRETMEKLRDQLATDRPTPPAGALLATLATGIPPEILLRSLEVTPEGFTVAGWIDPRASHAAWVGWAGRRSGPADRWIIAASAGPGPDGAFQFKGAFR